MRITAEDAHAHRLAVVNPSGALEPLIGRRITLLLDGNESLQGQWVNADPEAGEVEALKLAEKQFDSYPKVKRWEFDRATGKPVLETHRGRVELFYRYRGSEELLPLGQVVRREEAA